MGSETRPGIWGGELSDNAIELIAVNAGAQAELPAALYAILCASCNEDRKEVVDVALTRTRSQPESRDSVRRHIGQIEWRGR